jgi:hypothetical protein
MLNSNESSPTIQVPLDITKNNDKANHDSMLRDYSFKRGSGHHDKRYYGLKEMIIGLSVVVIAVLLLLICR